MTYYTRALPFPLPGLCCLCGLKSAGLWCDSCLEPLIEKGYQYRPEIMLRGPLAASVVLARMLVNSGARVEIP